MTPQDRARRPASRRPARRRYRNPVRRGRVAVAITAVVAAVVIGACTTIGRHASGPTTTSAAGGGPTTTSGPGGGGPTTTSGPGTTSRTTAAQTPGVYRVGIVTYHWKDGARTTVNPNNVDDPIAGRVLTTEIRYPTDAGNASSETVDAAPAKGGPFPVILFAHGFDVSPDYYEPLLDTWVRAGFVVVSPIFPDENTALVNGLGGPQSPRGLVAEEDLSNEPQDLAFVLRQFDAVNAPGSGAIVSGLAAATDVGLAGQSDGAAAVGALEYGSAFASARADLPVAPKAVEILSGQALLPASGAQNDYSSDASSPPVLEVQSRSDTCNSAQAAAQLFTYLTGAPVHLFQTLDGVSHLDPYVGKTGSSVVEKVTTEFFQFELGWKASSLSLGSIESAATLGGLSSISTTAPNFAGSPPGNHCVLPNTLDQKRGSGSGDTGGSDASTGSSSG